MYHYPCKIIKVVDGDTVDVDIDLGFGVWMKNQRIRMYGIDAPESRTSNQTEKQYGVASKRFLEGMCDDKNGLVLRTHKDKTGKFGRILGDFLIEDKSLGDIMVDKSLAVRYNGENKEEMGPAHLLNRTTLLHEGIVTPDDFT